MDEGKESKLIIDNLALGLVIGTLIGFTVGITICMLVVNIKPHLIF